MSSHCDKYFEEFIKNAGYIGTPGKGILAADESTGTIGKCLSSINVENIEENRRALRELLFCCPGALNTKDGKPFVDVLKEGGVLPGIKVDKGTIEVAGTDKETTTQGHDDLGKRCAKYYEAGARFRAVLKFGPNEPSQLAIDLNAQGLARYAITCQENGLVPITEPEIPVDGPHDIKKCADVTESVHAACYKALNEHHALVEEEASLNLNAMSKLNTKKPWSLSFSLGCVLQATVKASTLEAWANVEKARAAFLARCKANSEATFGIYKGDAAAGEGVSESLHDQDYKY